MMTLIIFTKIKMFVCVFFPPAEKITLYIEVVFTAGACHMINNKIVKYSLGKSEKNK